MKTLCVVQARTGSSRLPGKVLKEVKGKPLILHTLDRLKRCGQVDQIVLATSDLPQDRVLLDLATREGVKGFAGNEEDVLDRYYQAALQCKPEAVIRCTGDCPVIDPQIVDRVIERHFKAGKDYTSNTVVRTYPRGLDVEVMTFGTLEKAAKEATQNHEREHVTPYIYLHPERFTIEQVLTETEHGDPDLRLCVDTVEDFRFIDEIYTALHDKNPFFSYGDILDLLKSRPELKEINAHVKQKKNLPALELSFRPAEKQDCEFYFKVANNPVSRANSFNSQPILYGEHVSWFQKKLEDNKTQMYVLEVDGRAVGQIRFDRTHGSSCEVDIGVHPEWRGRGVAKKGLSRVSQFILKQGFSKTVVARIKKENKVSRRAFESAGFAVVANPQPNDQEIVYMVLERK